jgi:hypothetical protein
MLGTARSEELSKLILTDIEAIHALASELGAVRFEWVHDGERAWVVQLHRGATASDLSVLVQVRPLNGLSSMSRRACPLWVRNLQP